VKGYTERKVTKTTGRQEKRREWQRQKQKFWNRGESKGEKRK
jgi:phosphoribosyl-AMP cyclohydrolase